jgi:hypothetical protein
VRPKPLSNHKDDLENQEMRMIVASLQQEVAANYSKMVDEMSQFGTTIIGEIRRIEQVVVNALINNQR